MRRRLSMLEQGRQWERQFVKAQRHLRERQRHAGRPVRFREAAVRQRAAAVAQYVATHRRDLVATIAFVESYHGISVGRRPPASGALQTFRESYRRPAT